MPEIMTTRSPLVPPVSTSVQSATTSKTTTTDPQLPVQTSALRAFITRLSDSLRSGMSARRPWSEVTDRSAFSKPASISEAALRLRKNYYYFQVNYISAIGVILALSLVTHPFGLLLLLGLLSAWIFLYIFRPSDPPLVVLGRTFTERETLGLLIIFSVVVIFLTSVGSVLISALMVGSVIVCAHGSFRAPEDLFMDEQERAATGFLSFLGGAASNVAAAAAPVVAGRI